MKNIRGLTALRGLAIIMIILYHLFPDQVPGGFIGVQVFFVLAGFLLTVRAPKVMNLEEAGLFYGKRIRRIYPALVIVLAVCVVVMPFVAPNALGGTFELPGILLGLNNWWQLYANNSYFAQINNASPYTHLWYLSVLMQVYLVWPFILNFARTVKKHMTRGMADITLGALVLVSMMPMWVMYSRGAEVTRVYDDTFSRAFAVLVGAYAGMHLPSKKEMGLRQIAFGISLAVLGVSMFTLHGESAVTYLGGLQVTAVAAAVLCRLCAAETLPAMVMDRFKPLGFIGQLSYELYLVMYPVIFLFSYKKVSVTPVNVILELAVILGLAFILKVITRLLSSMSKARLSFPRQVRVCLCLALVLGCVNYGITMNNKNVTSDSAEEASESTATTTTTGDLDGSQVTLIGDSVLRGARLALWDTMPKAWIDSAQNRRVSDAMDVLYYLNRRGRLRMSVVIALGSNATFKRTEGQELIDYLGPKRKIYWVNVYGMYLGRQDATNKVIDALAADNDNVTVIDWASEADTHDDWFYDDGLHLDSEGRTAYAMLIYEALEKDA